MFVNAASVVTMLEYNWYGQVSEPSETLIISRLKCADALNLCRGLKVVSKCWGSGQYLDYEKETEA